jgi:hypothetical protein
MLSSCAGRISFQGGQYTIFPAAWPGVTLQLTDADLTGPITWKPRMSIRDTCNAVKGTYVSPENNWQLADVPAYMQDTDHGYSTDQYLVQDNNERIFKEAHFPCTTDSATAQRLEKIEMMRTRYQGRGTLRCSMKAYQVVALDVIQLTHPRWTWLNYNLEVLSSRLVVDKSNGAPRLGVELDVADTDPSILNWSIAEQLTPQGYAEPTNVGNSVCQPPDHPTTYSGPGIVISGVTYPSTISTGSGGQVQNSIYVSWNAPNDTNVTQGGYLEVQWQLAGATTWNGLGQISPSSTCIFINGVNAGANYNVQVRAVNCAGVPSPWVPAPSVLISAAWSLSLYSGVPVAPAGTLTALALAGGTAQINCAAFTPFYGPLCTPTPASITGLTQGELYWVYYIDPSFTGGAIVPIATLNESDCLNQAGYILIGSITTPTSSPRYQPSAYSVGGTMSVTDPAAAYDNNLATDVVLPSYWWSVGVSSGGPPVYSYHSAYSSCLWQGFPNLVTTAATTLYIVAAATATGTVPGMNCSIVATVAGVSTTLANLTAATATATYTLAIPAGTNLSTVTVQGFANITVGSTPGGSGSCTLEGFEIYIQ